ncbi:MAG: amino acid racemase [Candidatus Lokiarchaeota archaeon]|nr:amino acid racemase [Candidatus Lokiarchaeota archaeon]
MKKIGIIGGLGPESTILYYKMIIKKVHYSDEINYPEIIIESVDMKKVFDYIQDNTFEKLIDYLSNANKNLIDCGAFFSVIAANTPHIVFNEIKNRSSIPMISIVDETYKNVKKNNLNIVGLLGTKFTMEKEFYKDIFIKNNINIVIPNQDQRDYINRTIFQELEYGNVKKETKDQYLNIIADMKEKENIEAIILGCTELPLILSQDDFKNLKVYNTTEIHINSILEYYLE